MGLESYNFKISANKKISNEEMIRLLINSGYEVLDNDTLEKKSGNGFIEFSIENSDFWVRTASVNNSLIISEIFRDFKTINNMLNINVFDLQTKEAVSILDFGKTLTKFIELQEEFNKWFPKVKYPVRCNDVFKQVE